jgi:hypothetical protein
MAIDTRDRWRSTSPISSSEAPLRSMSVAKLCRRPQNVGTDVFLRWLEAGPVERIA